MLLKKYYFYCLDNEYSLAMIEKNLDHYFGDIEITYLDKEMNVIKDDDGKYRFEYIATVTDGDVTFEVVQIMRDENRKGGHLYKNEYESLGTEFSGSFIVPSGFFLCGPLKRIILNNYVI